MSQDYPDGMGRLLPGHTIDLETGFAQPWYNGSSVVIASGATGSYTLSFNDDEHIYYIDEINVSPSAYKEFTVIVYVNGVPYVCGSCMGYFIHNLRVNPSLLFITGDEVKVEILNLDASQRTFAVKIHGTKVSRPVGYGKAPGAYFTATPEITDIITAVAFTDASLETPTSWDWDFDDETAHSTSQSPSHLYSVAGTYQPKLKATNLYGWDTYAEHDMISVRSYCYFLNWTELDTGGKMYVDHWTNSIASSANTSIALLSKDYGVGYFSSFSVIFRVILTGVASGHVLQLFAVSNNSSAYGTWTNGRLSVYTWHEVVTGKVYISLGYNDGVNSADDSYWVPAYGDFYLRVTKSYASDVSTCYIYSDASMTVLLDTLTITNAALSNKSYRYLQACSTNGAVSSSGDDVLITNIVFESLS